MPLPNLELEEYLTRAKARAQKKFEALLREEAVSLAPDTVKQMWHSARNRAKKQGLPFTIGVEDLKIPKFCPVLGMELKRGTVKNRNSSPSLDRIIPELGYVPGNVVVVSFRANRIKNDSSIEELLLVAAFYDKLLKAPNDTPNAP